MNWKRAFKLWAAVFGLTIVGGLVWEWASGREVEIYLGSWRQDEEQMTVEADGARTLDFGDRVCDFSVDERLEVKMVRLVEKERLAAEVGRLRADGEMTEAARRYGREMVQGRYFAHLGRDGRDAGDRLKAAGVSFKLVGENLAAAPGVEAAHWGLMASETHKKNILESRFRRMGAGVLSGRACGVVVVENFAD